jgi:hypothetical protein
MRPLIAASVCIYTLYILDALIFQGQYYRAFVGILSGIYQQLR